MVPPASNRVPRARSYSGATSRLLDFAYRTFTSFGLSFQICSAINILAFSSGPQPQLQAAGLASFHFARRYFGNRCFFLFLRVLRCFSSPRSPHYTMYSCNDTCALPQVGSPIQKSADHWICAPSRSFSQLITSFIGS